MKAKRGILARIWRALQRRLGAKLFLSYLAIILVGSLTLWWATQWVAPAAFERHMGAMMRAMPGIEALLWATGLSVLTAAVVSWFVTRQVVAPIQALSQASQRIAQGHYDERVAVPGNLDEGVLDELGELAWNFNRMAAQPYVEGLIDGVLPSEPQVFAQILDEVRRLQRFVDDLREVSRMEAGALQLHREEIPPQELIESLVRRFQPAYQEKGVDLHTEIAPETPALWVDRERLLQVLSNLLDNALRYTPSGGRVTLRMAPEGEKWVRIEVQDTGVGIPPEHLPHIFKRFYRVEPSRSRAHGGSGLGLTIARLLVEAHGGQIWAESPGKNRGSTFIIRLPVSKKR